MARIAVIVPVYNGGSYLKQCIDSILGQTFRDLSCWLIDDGSTDGSGALCDQAAVQDGRVHVIHKQNEGLMATWMRGVRESREPYLCFVDCDDWIEPDMLEKMAGALTRTEQEPAYYGRREIICGNYVIDREWNHTSEEKRSAAAPGTYAGAALERDIKEKLLGNENRTLILSRCMKLVSRGLIEDNLGFCDPGVRMGEDVSIMVPAILDAERVVVLKDACDYHYRFVESSMVHHYDPGMYDNMVLLRRLLYRVMEEKNIPDGRGMVDREYLFLFFLVMKNEIRRKDVPAASVISRIQELCARENAPEMVRRYPGKLADPANRILAWMMEKPDVFRIRTAKAVFDLKG